MARRPSPRGARRPAWPALLAAAAAALAHAPSLGFGFVYDDRYQVVESPWIADLGNLGRAFTENAWAFDGQRLSYYRPVMHATYMLTYAAAGLTPWAYHALNVLLHALNAALVALLAAEVLRRAGLPAPEDEARRAPAAAAAGLLFALHPALVEAVSWIACIPELVYSAGFLGALLLHARADRLGPWARWGSVAAFSLALLSKEPAILLPLALVAFDVAAPPPDLRPGALARRYLPYAAAAACYLAVRHAVLGASPLLRSNAGLGGGEALVNALALFARYLATLALPIDLNAYHLVDPVRSLGSAAGLLALLVTAAFAGAALLALRQRSPALVGLALVALPILPVLYAPLLAGENTFAERYLYLSGAGAALLAALGLSVLDARWPARRGALVAGAAAVLLACAAGTVVRARVWRSDETLWTDAAAKTPGSGVVRHELGVVHLRAGRLEAAEGELRGAVALLPSMSLAHYNLALVLERTGREAEALAEYRRALAGDRPTAEAWTNLGQLLERGGRPGDAIGCYLEALKLRPDALDARLDLGRAYDAAGRPDDALAQYQAALAAAPRNPDAHLAMGIAFGMRGDLGRALGHLTEAARLAPSDPIVLRNLAQALRLSGRGAEAEAALARAAALEAAAAR